MGESETISWIKSQLNAGYSRSRIKEMLMNSGYDSENVDKLLSLAVADDSESGNSAQSADGSDIAHEQKNDVHEESWIKVGGYAGVSVSIAFVVVFLTLMFFDKISSLWSHAAYGAIILFGAFIVANRNSEVSLKRVACSAFVCSLILAVAYIVFAILFGDYVINPDMGGSESTILFVSMARKILFFGGIIGIVVLSIVFCLIMRFVLKRVYVKKMNVLKPVALFGGLYLLGMGLFCFTGPKIAHEPIEVYWCEEDGGELCNTEELYERGLIAITGYSIESYFTQVPNTNNRFAMKKYELATVLLTMMNSASIKMHGVEMAAKYEDMNLIDEYYDSVIRKTEFHLDELELEEKRSGKAVILCVDGYNSYLASLKNMIERHEIDYESDRYESFKDKEQHLKYIQAKIDINNGLKESYKYVKLSEENAHNSYYSSKKIEVIEDTVDDYKRFVNDMSTRIIITDVSFEDGLEGSIAKKIEIIVKNAGLCEIEYEPEDILVSVNGIPVSDLECAFKALKVDEEGVCSGTTRDDEPLQKEIILSLPVGPRSTYLYEKE